MKKIYLSIVMVLTLISATFTSCDFLDVMPDETIKYEDTYETPGRVLDFLYSCYAYLPVNRGTYEPYWVASGGELIAPEKEDLIIMLRGDYGPSQLRFTNKTWDNVWKGIRQCYLFLSLIDKATCIDDDTREDYRNEAKFLIAYYHFISLSFYGPTFIIDHMYAEDTPIVEFPERRPYDEVVQWVSDRLDEVIPLLPPSRSGEDFGRATKYAAMALKSRMYLYAASPLYNGNSEMYNNFVSKDGVHLISQEYSEQKWIDAADVTKKAITEMEGVFSLYDDQNAGEPTDAKPGFAVKKDQRRLRYTILDYNGNPEIIWADCRREGQYGFQRRMTIKDPGKTFSLSIGNCIVPPLQIVEEFYTKNGLPMNQDKTYDYTGRYSVVNIPTGGADGNHYDDAGDANKQTLKGNIDREPRYYAWIGFHNGFAEMAWYNDKATNSAKPALRAARIQMLKNDPQGRGNNIDSQYSPSGYTVKKLVPPSWNKAVIDYPWCLFRMGELYLNYAEALIEIGGDTNLETARTYINKIRTRAGIPTIEVAWTEYGKNANYYKTQKGMRDIVRRERCLELFLEGHRFLDVRRWKDAEGLLNRLDMGLNVDATTLTDFAKTKEILMPRSFDKAHYLMPIPSSEIDKNARLVQNPFYN